VISFAPTSPGLRHCRRHLPLDTLHGATADADHRRHLQYAVPGAQMAFSTSGNTLGRPSFLPAGAHDLIRQGPCCGASFLSCSPKTDAI
jgi:hypothetical protein